MKMEDCIIIRRPGRQTGAVYEEAVSGVLCTVTDIVSLDGSGLSKSGQLIIRIPELETALIRCGDEVSPDGGRCWFTVTEVRDNRGRGSFLSHRKVIGRR